MIVTLDQDLLQRLSRLDSPTAATEDANEDLASAVRHAATMRRLFYAAVLTVALYGTATGALATFALPWPIALGGVVVLELGGVVFLSNADVRRRLGEHATFSRMLGALIAAAAATFNLLTHPSTLFGGFFALMSVLGFVAWWLDVENKRRDRLRAQGQLAAATPSYELWAHWLRHPVITKRACGLAKAYPQLGLYGSLEAAVITRRREKRNAALATALRKRIRTSVGKDLADIAVLTFDIDQVAHRLSAAADYNGMSALLASELTADRVLHGRDDPAAVAARAWLAADRSNPPALHCRDGGHRHTEPVDLVPPGPIAIQALAKDNPTAADDKDRPSASSLRGGRRAHPPGIRPAVRHGGSAPLEHSTPTVVSHQADAGPVTIRVLGAPAILHPDGTAVSGLRSKSIELLAFLTMHPAGVAKADILADIWPEVPAERAEQRLSTCLANLRSVIRQLLESADLDAGRRKEPIVNSAGTYRLEPAVVTADWWAITGEVVDPGWNGGTALEGALNDALDQLDKNTDFAWIDLVRQRMRHAALDSSEL